MPRSLIIGGFILSVAGSAWAQNTQSSTHAALREWVRTEKSISDEAADWQAEQAVLEDMITVLEMESAQLAEQMAAVEATIADSTAKTEALTRREQALRKDLKELSQEMTTWETQAQAMVASWPDPLKIQFKNYPTLQRKVTNDSAWLGRAQRWIELFREADQFNREVTVFVNTAELDGGESWQVSEIYYGLAGGFWTSADGSQGGLLMPSADGWTRTNDSVSADMAEEMIAIANSRRPSVHVEAPVTVD